MATLSFIFAVLSSIHIFSISVLCQGVKSPYLNLSLKADDGGVGQQLWCVAKNNAEDPALQSALDWACGQGGSDCRPVQEGGPCYEPTDIQSHASYAFNDYFIRNGNTPQSCDFAGTAALTSLNPSHGSCIFPSSSGVKNGSFIGTSGNYATGPGVLNSNDSPISSRGGLHLILALSIFTVASIFQ